MRAPGWTRDLLYFAGGILALWFVGVIYGYHQRQEEDESVKVCKQYMIDNGCHCRSDDIDLQKLLESR
jgi:hypothetical protein